MNRRDDLHGLALRLSADLGERRIVTSQMVMVEVLNSFSEFGPHFRLMVSRFAEALLRDPKIEIVEQTGALFGAACALYKARADKAWSLTDCASFTIMQQAGITDALTHDLHFSQIGFVAMMRNA